MLIYQTTLGVHFLLFELGKLAEEFLQPKDAPEMSGYKANLLIHNCIQVFSLSGTWERKIQACSALAEMSQLLSPAVLRAPKIQVWALTSEIKNINY